MTRRGLVLFGLMSVIWGIPYLLIRVAVEEVSPAALVFARTSIAVLILLPVALLRVDLRPVLARWRWLAVFAIVEIAIPWVMLGLAEQHVSSSLAALLIAATPLVGALVALATGGTDRMTRMGSLGLFVGMAGVVAIVGADFEADDLVAFIQLGVVAVCYAVGPAILARRLDGLPSVGVMSLSLALTALIYVPIAALDWPTTVPSRDALLAIAILGIVCTAAAFLIFAALIAEVGPVRSTVITYINPAVAAVLGVVVLNERFTIGMAIGFVLVIIGSVLATRRPRGAVAGAVRPEVAEADGVAASE
jgi:drug/metabolite transporter (DMT)-like permease